MPDAIEAPPWFWLGCEADAAFIAQVVARPSDYLLSRRVIDAQPIQNLSKDIEFLARRNPDLCCCIVDQGGYPMDACPYYPPCIGQCRRFGMNAMPADRTDADPQAYRKLSWRAVKDA